MKKVTMSQIKLPKNNLSRFTIMFGLLGTLCLIISHFIPCLTVGGLSKYFINEEWYLVVLSFLSIVMIFMGKLIVPALTSGFSLYFFIDYTSRINTVYKQYAANNEIFYGIGYYLLLVGFALTTTYVIFGLREKIKIWMQLKKAKNGSEEKNETLQNNNEVSLTPVNEEDTPTILEELKVKEEVKKEEPTVSIWQDAKEESEVSPINEEKLPETTIPKENLLVDSELSVPKEPQSTVNEQTNLASGMAFNNAFDSSIYEPTTDALKESTRQAEDLTPMKEPVTNQPMPDQIVKNENTIDSKETSTTSDFNPFTFTLPDDVHDKK